MFIIEPLRYGSSIQYRISKAFIDSEYYRRKYKLLSLCSIKASTIYPNSFRRNTIANRIRLSYSNKPKELLTILNLNIATAGRITNIRSFGKLSFLTLQDTGGYIQLYISCDTCSTYKEQANLLELGDIVGACGKLFKTKAGELSICCYDIRLLTKPVRPLPNKYHGLINKELCYRQRYLDLVYNERARYIFKARTHIISELRSYMLSNSYIEVETPMMHLIPGGALARPFITHHNTLNIDMYLRVAPELYMKRLVVGGFEKIFEINRSFRNEGLSAYHNPEFTMMELYMAYANYIVLMELVEDLFKYITKSILGRNTINYGNIVLAISKAFIKIPMLESICSFCSSITYADLTDIKLTKDIASSLDIKLEKEWGLGKVQTHIFKRVVESMLKQTTFIINYPSEVSPLARRLDRNPFLSERFEVFINGKEVGNGFSELNDSSEQSLAFINQLKEKEPNDRLGLYEADYIKSLEYGLPPTAGLGIGIDRLVMVLANASNIRDVILFPTMRTLKAIQ
ncbi:lysine--tRNA ligase [Candidatus Tremblaya phenacola]|nr:lysine--tRNA ligase [Candidatus Tremblaya phenacola]